MTIGTCVAVPKRYIQNPTEPGDCSAAVVSVACSNHEAGSTVPFLQTSAAIWVVPTPLTWNRTRNTSPAA